MSDKREALEKVELLNIIGESVKWYNYFGEEFASFFEHTTTTKPRNSALKYLSKIHENVCFQKTKKTKTFYKNIDSSFSCTSYGVDG